METPSKSQPQPVQPRIPVGLLSNLPGIMQQPASLYANGFEIGVTGADIAVQLTFNGRPLATLNLSFTTAKAMGVGLSSLIAQIEAGSQTKVLTVEEVVKALESGAKPQ